MHDAGPPLQVFRRKRLHRLIPAKYSTGSNATDASSIGQEAGGTVLAEIANDASMLADIMLLDGATNDRIQGEHHGLSGITPYELVYGVPNAHIVRAAFLHASPFGGRFNDATRGAWYAAVKLENSIAEVVYHRARHLAEIVVPELPAQMPDSEVSIYDDWQADFDTALHSLEPVESYAECLEPEPVPGCYLPAQMLARRLLQQRSNGIAYPSVRHPGGICIVCFRPALIYRPRQAGRYQIRLTLAGERYTSKVRPVPV